MKNLTKTFVLISLVVLTTVFVACKKDSEKVVNENDDETSMEKKELAMPTPEELGRAYGIILGSSVKNLELELDTKALAEGFEEVAKAKELDNEKANNAEIVVMNAITVSINRANEKRKREGEDFLTKNAKRPEVIQTESGLQYEIIKEGTGRVALPEGTVKLHYVGKFLDGREFDNSKNQSDDGVVIPASGLIPAWQEALKFMKEGGKYKLYAPYHLAYGERGLQAQGQVLIPAFSTLQFEIELVEVRAGKAAGKKPLSEE